MNYHQFAIAFPSFSHYSSEEIEANDCIAVALRGKFEHVGDPDTRQVMCSLSLAHELQLKSEYHAGGQIKSIKNQQDRIEFAVMDSNKPFGLESTAYGANLAKLMRVYNAGGFLSVGRSSCGC